MHRHCFCLHVFKWSCLYCAMTCVPAESCSAAAAAAMIQLQKASSIHLAECILMSKQICTEQLQVTEAQHVIGILSPHKWLISMHRLAAAMIYQKARQGITRPACIQRPGSS